MVAEAVIRKPVEVIEEKEHLNILEIFLGIIIRPKRTFAYIKENNKSWWWVVFAATIALSAAAGLISAAQMSSMMAERALEMGMEVSTSTMTTTLISIGLGAVSTLLGYVFTALVIYGLSFFMGGNSTYKSIFRMSVWATVPAVFRNLVALISTIAGSGSSATGLAGVMTIGEMMSSPIIAALLAKIDVYLIWSLTLLVIGMMVTTKISLKKSLIVLAVYLVLSAGMIAGYTALSSSISEMLGTDLNLSSLTGTSGGGGSGGGGGTGAPPADGGGGGGGGGRPGGG